MEGKRIAGLALLAGLGWFLWPRPRVGLGTNVPGIGTRPPGESDFTKLFHEYAVGDGVSRLGGRDVIADLQPDPISVKMEQAELESGKSRAGNSIGAIMWGFHWQVAMPASRIKIADLQPYHFQLANAMLAGNMQRDDAAGNLYQRLLDDIAANKATAHDLAIANSVVTAVASVIPVIGGAIAIAASTGIQEGQKGAAHNLLQDVTEVQTVGQIKAGLGVGSPAGKAWTRNDRPEFPIDGQWVTGPNGVEVDVCSIGLTELYGFWMRQADGDPASISEASYYKRETINGVTASRQYPRPGYEWQRVNCRMKLFSMHAYGWILPWLSPDMGYGSKDPNTGVPTTLTQRVGLRAAVLRAFDLMICQLDPLPLPADGQPVLSRYWYISPVWGPIFGSVFPPDEGSVHFQDGLNKWDFNGGNVSEGMTSLESDFVTRKPFTYSAPQSSVTLPGQQTTEDAPPPTEDYGQVAVVQAGIASAEASAVNYPTTGSGIVAARAAKGYR